MIWRSKNWLHKDSNSDSLVVQPVTSHGSKSQLTTPGSNQRPLRITYMYDSNPTNQNGEEWRARRNVAARVMRNIKTVHQLNGSRGTPQPMKMCRSGSRYDSPSRDVASRLPAALHWNDAALWARVGEKRNRTINTEWNAWNVVASTGIVLVFVFVFVHSRCSSRHRKAMDSTPRPDWLTDSLASWLTYSWSRVLLQKLKVAMPFKKFPTFCRKWRSFEWSEESATDLYPEPYESSRYSFLQSRFRVVSIATGYGLDDWGVGIRVLVG
jgi:hypothetical protein